MSAIGVFEDLATELARRWDERDHDERVFAELATQVLAARKLHTSVQPQQLLDWVIDRDTLPVQLDPEGRFGQPPITLVRHPKFVVDALFWLDGTTDIHQHGFSGAFQVLAGGSVHATYEWSLRERVNAAIMIGDVKFRGFDLLGLGDTRTIGAGSELIHGLFHLDRPSVTIVVRTIIDRECGPQYSYRIPYLAIDPNAHDPVAQRQIESLQTLKQLGLDHEAAFTRLLRRCDFATVFRLGEHHLRTFGDLDRLREHLELARPRHGTRIDVLPAVFAEMGRKSAIVKKRELLTGADHRFFLAMMLNLPTRSAILDAISRRYEGDPVPRVVGWVSDLADALAKDLRADGEEDHSMVVLAEMLRGYSGGRLLEKLDEEFDIEDVRDSVLELEQALRRAPTLRTLLDN